MALRRMGYMSWTGHVGNEVELRETGISYKKNKKNEG
jgi:hypothetical protein